MMAPPRASALVFVLAALMAAVFGSSSVCAQYGYVPTPAVPGVMEGGGTLAAAVPATSAEPSGFGHPRGGLFFQIEGATLSVGGLGDAGEEALSALDAETTYGLMATLGHIGSSGLGIELSAGYYTLEFDGGVSDLYGKLDADVSAKLTVVPIFVDARFSLGLTEHLSLEVGAGIGGIYGHAEAQANTSVGDYSASRDAFAFGYQGLAALTVALGSHADLTLHYRYMVLSAVDNLTAQSVGLGLRLRL